MAETTADNVDSDSTAPAAASALISAPRSSWRVALLNLATIGVYPCFWMFGRARDLKHLQSPTIKPWLWFFSPLVAFTLCFSFPRLLTEYEAVGKRVDIGPWPAAVHGFGVLLFVVAVIQGIQDFVEMPFSVFVAAFLIWSVLFAWPQSKIGVIHGRVSDASYRGGGHGFSAGEWAVLVLGTPLALAIIVALVYLDVRSAGGEPVDGRVDVPETPLTIDFPVRGWRQTAPGTYTTDADAEAEFGGPLVDQWFVVYAYTPDYTLQGLVEGRLESAQSSMSGVACEEKRSFAGTSLHVSVRLVCQGRYLGDPVMEGSHFIETTNGIYELFGHLSTVELSFAPEAVRMRQTLDSLQVLP